MILKPFFSYFGGKYRAAPSYPGALCNTIVEPFAGSAGYSLRYSHRPVLLYDTYEVAAGLWEYLINVSEEEILGLPVQVSHVNDLKVCQEAKWLIGFWLGVGNHGRPCLSPSKWMRDRGNLEKSEFWGYGIRNRIADQVKYIRHWKVFNKPYHEAPDIEATWFVDPPYIHLKTYGGGLVNYKHLAGWCKGRKGRVIVCEKQGANWLPFQPHKVIRSLKGTCEEVIWTKEAA